MLTHRGRVHRRSDDGEDIYGNPVPVFTPGAEVPARLEPSEGTEIVQERDTVITRWKLYLLPDVEISARDRWEQQGKIFEVVGPPQVETRPRQGPHHIEAQLRYISG